MLMRLSLLASLAALGCNAGDFTFRPRVPGDAPQSETVVMDETLTGPDGPTVDASPDAVFDTAPDASPDAAPDGAPDVLDVPVIQDTPDVLVPVDVADVSTDIPMPLDVRDASPEVLDAPIMCARTDQCPMGQFCGSRGTCLSRCTGNSDCRSASTEPLCNPMSMVCVSGTTSCRTRADCAGLDCSDTGVCTQSCVSASTCVAGQFCSTMGYCTFGCSGSPCPSGLVCRGGSCGAPVVDAGVMDVTPTDVPPPSDVPPPLDVSGCMAPTPTRCGATCVDTLSNASHCGACGTVCSLSNATPRCLNGACRVETCNTGFGNCDALATNGCETDLRTSSTHCGACDVGCTPPRVCNAGVCSTTCTGTMCGTSCVFTDRDVSNCGACGQVCSAVNGVAACGLSRCSITCNPGFGDCDATRPGCETSFQNNTTHCGRCGGACSAGQMCSSGTCVGGACPVGLTMCATGCVETNSSATNCGGCGRTCLASQTCLAGACSSAIVRPSFQVRALAQSGCVTAEHEALTGDDRGGIAVSMTRVFYTGDTATARFSALDLSGGVPVMPQLDGLLGNLRTGQVYTLAIGMTPYMLGRTGSFDSLIEMDGNTGGLIRLIRLSSPIALSTVSGDSGVFSGYDRAVILTGGRAYNIDLPTGMVSDLGAMPLPTRRSNCESWAIWGVAEFFGGNLYIAYVQDRTTVVRTRVPDGVTSVITTFMDLSDMCSFTVSPMFNRWYFHHEVSSQFTSGMAVAEVIGYCPASLVVGP